MNYSFSLIIPNLNGEKLLTTCLNSIFSNHYKLFEVILIDNNSTDSSLKIATSYPKIKIIKSQKNLGFGEAINTATSVAKNQFLIVLNNDVILSKNWISTLNNLINKHPNYFCFAGTIYTPNKTIENTGFIFKKYGRAQLRKSTKNQEIWGAPATAICYRAKQFKLLGGFSKKYFAYIEDVDLHYKANLLNLKSYYSNRLKAVHIGGATAGQNTVFRAWNSLKGWLIFISTNYSLYEIIANLPLIFVERLRNISYLLRVLVK